LDHWWQQFNEMWRQTASRSRKGTGGTQQTIDNPNQTPVYQRSLCPLVRRYTSSIFGITARSFLPKSAMLPET